MAQMMQRIAMKAVIVNDKGQVLIVREASTYDEGTNHGRYHVPGGRIDAGEPFEEGLKREVREETGLEVKSEYPLFVGEWWPVIKGVKTQIIAVFMVCKPLTDEIILSDEHDDYQWIDPERRQDYDLMPPEDQVIDLLATSINN